MGEQSSRDSKFPFTVRKEAALKQQFPQIRNIPHYDEPHENDLCVYLMF